MSTTTTPELTLEQAMDAATIRTIALTSLEPSTLNPRVDMGDLEHLGGQLAAGQITDLIVSPWEDVEGLFEVLDGHRRLAAAAQADLSTLSCKVLPAGLSKVQKLRLIQSTGTTGKQLLKTEQAALVQTLFDLEPDEARIATVIQATPETVRGLRALAGAPAALRERTDAGQQTLEEAIALEEARVEFAEDPDRLARIEEEAGGWGNVAREVRAARGSRANEALRELILEAGLKPAPGTSMWMPTADGFETWSEDARDWESRDRSEALEKLREIARSGATYSLSGDGTVYFRPKQPRAPKAGKDAPAESVEATPEQIAAAKARHAAEMALKVVTAHREEHIRERFARTVSPLAGVGPQSAFSVLLDMCAQLVEDWEYSHGVEASLLLYGVPVDTSTDDWVKRAVEPARAYFKGKKIGWLVAFLYDFETARDRDRTASTLRGLDLESSGTRGRVYLEWAQKAYGWQPPAELASVLTYLDGDGLTVGCVKCGQQVVATADWAGVCEPCSSEPSA
jgi:ParB-like chromosome segregation protein Spo0J